MSFKEAIVSAFQNYAKFSGRARRSEYWYFVLFVGIVSFVLGMIGSFAGDSGFGSFVSLLTGLFDLAVLVPSLALCWRRLHDIGKSGGYYFLSLIPVVGIIILLVWLCKDSMPGENAYGPNPKEVTYTY